MTRFFFHVRDDKTYIKDAEGQELPDLDAARDEATVAARQLLSEALLQGNALIDRQFEIADAQGIVCAVIPFRDVVRFT